jgi:hypothetical protein
MLKNDMLRIVGTMNVQVQVPNLEEAANVAAEFVYSESQIPSFYAQLFESLNRR